ncbi:MAG: hypothetical protein SGPRY_008028, partial [Prymnesium sp.]
GYEVVVVEVMPVKDASVSRSRVPLVIRRRSAGASPAGPVWRRHHALGRPCGPGGSCGVGSAPGLRGARGPCLR